MLVALYAVLRVSKTGLVVRAALTHPATVETLGHDVPRVFTMVFAVGTALAALAGVIGAPLSVIEPAMADAMGPIVFVVVVIGGLGSLGGALVGVAADRLRADVRGRRATRRSAASRRSFGASVAARMGRADGRAARARAAVSAARRDAGVRPRGLFGERGDDA